MPESREQPDARLERLEPTTATPPGSSPASPSWRSGRYGWIIGYFWSSVWLFWLLQPLGSAWRRGSWLGIVGVVGFAAVYLFHFHRRGWMFSDSPGASVKAADDRPVQAALRWFALLALAILTMATTGQTGISCLIFVGISAMWTFSIRRALVLAFLTGIATWALWHSMKGWTSDYGSLIGLSFGTLACGVGRISAQRKWALDASREDASLLRLQDERNRMARDIHDILGHSLTVIAMKAELAGKLIDVDPGKAKEQITELESLSRSALADVRQTVSGYREMSLAGELARARRALNDAGIRVDMPGSVEEVSPDLRELFAWTVREATTNIIRHSGAKTCTVILKPTKITIVDDGRGMPQDAASAGMPGAPGTSGSGTPGNGLVGLRERAAAHGAHVIIRSSNGFKLIVEALPSRTEVLETETPSPAWSSLLQRSPWPGRPSNAPDAAVVSTTAEEN